MKLKDIILALLSPGLLILGIALSMGGHGPHALIYIAVLYAIIITLYFLYNLIKNKDKKKIIYIIIALIPVFEFIMPVHILILQVFR
ncbi:MAG: hypothetical protein ABL867_02490 [Rickettsiales bacterium]